MSTETSEQASLLRLAYAILNELAQGRDYPKVRELAGEWCRMYRDMRERQARDALQSSPRIVDLAELTPAETPLSRGRNRPR